MKLWRGLHSPEVRLLIKEAWLNEELLILCPPSLKDFSFVAALTDDFKTAGSWDSASLQTLHAQSPSQNSALAVVQSTLQATVQAPGQSKILGVFTSNTSSASPRLVLYSKENIIQSLENIRSLFDTKKIKQIFCYPQPTHAFGLILGYVHSFFHDLELVTGEGRYSHFFHELWLKHTHSHTLSLGTPTHFQDLNKYLLKTGTEHSLRPTSYSCITGGAPVSVQLWQSLREDLRIENPSIGYGSSEATLGVTHLPPGLAPHEDGEVGFFLPRVQAKIIPEVGVEVRGPTVCEGLIENGVLKNPERILITDILSRRASDGCYVFRGRTELVLNRGGRKFSLEHVEQLLQSELGIEAICVAMPHGRLGEELGIVSVQNDQKGIYKKLSEAFGCEFESDFFLAVDSLPLNSQSKYDRKSCLALLEKKVLVDRHRSEEITFPIVTTALSNFLPHRAPAVWIDEVISLTSSGGVCRTTLTDGNYMSLGWLRRSSLIEFMAQAYGFVEAARQSEGLQDRKLQRAFLVGAKNLKFSETLKIAAGETILTSVEKTYELGNVSLIEGRVSDSENNCLLTGQIKIFAD